MAKHRLSKSTYIRSLQCQKSLYLHSHRPFLRDKISAEQLAKFKRGTDVGVLARELFPGGIDMTPGSPSALAKKREETLRLLADPEVSVLYEAVFEYDEVLIMLDILVRHEDAWKAIEVKSSLRLSETYIRDAALQYYVLKGNGLQVSSFQLMHINPQYVFKDRLKLDELFLGVEVLDQLELLQPETASAIAQAKQTLDRTRSPEIPVGRHCFYPYPCDFTGHCWKNIPPNHVFRLRSLNSETAFRFLGEGRYLPEDIANEPEYLMIDPAELRAFSQNSLTASDKAKESLKAYRKYHNLIYLKLLTLQPAVPFINGFVPYQHVPMAISWHNNPSTCQVFDMDSAGSAQAASIISELIMKHDFVITDDAEALMAFCQASGLQAKEISRIVGIRQLVDELPLYHPGFSRDIPFENMAKTLTGKTLTSNHWLKHDLLLADNPAKMQTVLDKLGQYPKVIRLLWEKIMGLL
ncbi:MAG TPA: hypothetical protein PKE03_04785 [Bacteroidales bacterium]|nr:hypothetical protein [Bacteroidales bacterium]